MKIGVLITLVILLSGCSSVDISQYQQSTPEFDLYQYFSGETKGYGIVQDRSGLVTRQFVVNINGSISQADELILEEDFLWSDLQTSSRTWQITRSNNNVFEGKAADVVGVAEGSSQGNTLNWKYHLNVEVGDSTWKIFLDDWMYLQADNILINKTTMTKFGFHVGDITIVFRKDLTL